MLFEQAKKLAVAWVDVVLVGKAAIQFERTMHRPYGWVFFYQSKEYIKNPDPMNLLVGAAPIIIDRINGEIIVTGTGKPIEDYLGEYEATLPPARLLMMPERHEEDAV